MKKSMLSTKQSYLMCAVGIVVLFGILMGVCESGMASTYIKGIMMTSCIAIIMTTSLNLTIGVLGQLTLGCCGFEAIGAYSAALLSKLLVANGVAMDPTLRFLLTTLAGGVVACIFGILVGIPALRLHGDSKHHDKERYHKAFSFPVHRIAVDQSQFDGAILHLLGIKVQSIDSTTDHSDFYHCGKQQTIKQQLQYDHCFSPLSLRANRAYAPIFFASYCGS